MQWSKLICHKRLGMERYRTSSAQSRSDFQRDFDRLVFSSPFRRLQNKTQVFPLPGSIFVHNRLTHSLEVSSVGKSLANEVYMQLSQRYRHDKDVCDKLSHIVEIVGAACLAHDLGNPPFGHSGERTIATYFSEGDGMAVRGLLSENEWNDLINFDGNANSFRLLSHQFKGRREGGLAMTYSTLAAIVKYPYSSSMTPKRGKFGYFCSERECFMQVADELGLIQKSDDVFARHPLVLLMEAADDICYQVMDIEDAHKLKILTTEETKALYCRFFTPKRLERTEKICSMVSDTNEQIAYLRTSAIGVLIKECVKTFVEYEENILDGNFEGTLISHLPEHVKEAYENCSRIAFDKIYFSKDVVDIELAGYQVITTLVDLMIEAVRYPEKAYSQLLINRVSKQYEIQAPTLYARIQAVLDYISGMTDVYALDLYRKINGNSLPAV